MPPLVSAGLFAHETEWRLGRHISLFSAGCQEFFCWKFWARSTDSKVTKGEKHERPESIDSQGRSRVDAHGN